MPCSSRVSLIVAIRLARAAVSTLRLLIIVATLSALCCVVDAQQPADPLDINTATAAQLRSLPGMGGVYARRVIEGRPYASKNQLATRGVLPQAEYERIAPLIIAHRIATHPPATAPGAAAPK